MGSAFAINLNRPATISQIINPKTITGKDIETKIKVKAISPVTKINSRSAPNNRLGLFNDLWMGNRRNSAILSPHIINAEVVNNWANTLFDATIKAMTNTIIIIRRANSPISPPKIRIAPDITIAIMDIESATGPLIEFCIFVKGVSHGIPVVCDAKTSGTINSSNDITKRNNNNTLTSLKGVVFCSIFFLSQKISYFIVSVFKTGS
jgi:hypothetical protein